LYKSYWGLQEKPFENTPDPRFLYQSADTMETYARLLYALKSNRGAVLLTGESGCGKTLMARALIQGLDPERTDVALLANPCRHPDDLLPEILFQIGGDEPPQDRTQVVRQLNATLYDNFSAGRETAVIIDEGQLLENPKFFEEFCVLLNFQLNDAFLVTLVLVGQPLLAERVRNCANLDERLSARGVVRALEKEDVGPYIELRLSVAGRTAPAFSPDAVEMVAQHTGGVPRRINHLCDLCLVIGYSRKVDVVDEDLVYRLILNEGENRV
jgi:general secretion pathway protein A